MEHLTRKCPCCNKDIHYEKQSSYDSAIKHNSKCTSCRSRRYPIENEYKRICPCCGKDIIYGSRGTRDFAEKHNKVCKYCRLTWQQDKFGEKNIYEFYTYCRLCGRKKI